jgi:NAD(P)-dependent dehydrogenase (short-subunit alcohol dehydrogenase family)
MAGRVQGKAAVVVGGGQTKGETIGNGRATAIVLAREGARSSSPIGTWRPRKRRLTRSSAKAARPGPSRPTSPGRTPREC